MVRYGNGYLFVISSVDASRLDENHKTYTVYDHTGRRLFSVDLRLYGSIREVFVIGDMLILASCHINFSEISVAYNIRTGERMFEWDIPIQGVYPIGQYYAINHNRNAGVITNRNFELIANLPNFTGVANGNLLFDNAFGVVREASFYTLDELREIAAQGVNS